MSNPLLRIAIDLETAARNKAVAKVTEVAASVLDNGFKPTGSHFSSLVGRSAEELSGAEAKEALALTGITAEELAAARPQTEVFDQLNQFIRTAMEGMPEGTRVQLVGHNINSYDVPILKGIYGDSYHTLFYHQNVDTLEMAQAYSRVAPGQPYPNLKLNSVAAGVVPAARLETITGTAHRAQRDALVSAMIAEELHPKVGLGHISGGFAVPPPGIAEKAVPTSSFSDWKLAAGLTAAAYMSPDSREDEVAAGVRQPYPTGQNEFEAMNPHGDYGFPGGRAQPYNINYTPRTVQTDYDTHRSKVPSQRGRLAFHPSGAFPHRPRSSPGPVRSRRERP